MSYFDLLKGLRVMATDFGRGIYYGLALESKSKGLIDDVELMSIRNIAYQLNGGKRA